MSPQLYHRLDEIFFLFVSFQIYRKLMLPILLLLLLMMLPLLRISIIQIRWLQNTIISLSSFVQWSTYIHTARFNLSNKINLFYYVRFPPHVQLKLLFGFCFYCVVKTRVRSQSGMCAGAHTCTRTLRNVYKT